MLPEHSSIKKYTLVPVTVTVGSADSNPKTIEVPAGLTCPTEISKDNWAGPETFGDTFTVTHNTKTTIIVTRTDQDSSWGMNLEIICRKGNINAFNQS